MEKQTDQTDQTAQDAARYRALRQSASLQGHQMCPDRLASVRLSADQLDAETDKLIGPRSDRRAGINCY